MRLVDRSIGRSIDRIRLISIRKEQCIALRSGGALLPFYRTRKGGRRVVSRCDRVTGVGRCVCASRGSACGVGSRDLEDERASCRRRRSSFLSSTAPHPRVARHRHHHLRCSRVARHHRRPRRRRHRRRRRRRVAGARSRTSSSPTSCARTQRSPRCRRRRSP